MINQHHKNGKCIIYGRVSTQNDTQSNSLMVQTMDSDDFSMFDEFKISYAYETYAIYSDDTSGTTHNRKGYQDMLYFFGIERKEVTTDRKLPTGNLRIKKHYVYDVNEDTVRYVRDVLKIDYILCKNTSRWTRQGDFELIQILRNNGIYIYFKDEGIDTFDSDTDTLLGIIQKLDRSKSTDTSKKMKSGMESSIKLGRIRTNTFIYGFQLVQRDNNESSLLVPIPEEAEVIKLIFKLYTEDGLGSRQIANKLNEMGIVTRTNTTKKGKTIGGIPFGVTSIKRILQNEKYCGYINIEKRWETGEVFNNISPKRIYGYKIRKSEYIEPIVSYETFIKAQEICKQRSDKTSERGRYTGNSVYLHKIKCSVCGGWFCQNGEINAKGEYIKKMNCGNKKRKGLKYCDSDNIQFTEIEKRYEELSENFQTFLEVEIRKNKKQLLYILLTLFELYYNSDETNIEQIKEDMKKSNDLYDGLLMQRIGLEPTSNAARLLANRMEEVSSLVFKYQEQLEKIYKYKETFRPYINRLLDSLYLLSKIDTKKSYTIEEIKNFDIILYVGKSESHFELQVENYNEFLTAFDEIPDFVTEYMKQTENEINDYLKRYYELYEVKTEYYI